MPNALTSTGLTLAQQSELVTTLTQGYQAIYGPNINLDSSSPDGQMMMIFIQAILDVQDVLMTAYTSFDPNQAFGTILDQRVAINGIQRLGGSYTLVNITVVTSQGVNLNGLDNLSAGPAYTVSDNQGNQYNLVTTTPIASAGTYVLKFQAANPGAITPTINTITVPVTIVLGVTSVNNPNSPITIGINEETDNALKIRRAQSVSNSSQGYLAGLIGSLQALASNAYVAVYENNTGSTNADGTPSHSIWVIFSGSASAAAIANVIYTKRNAGCGMRGAQSYSILQVDGSYLTIYWDNVVTIPMFIFFNAASLNGTSSPNIAGILSGLPTSFVPAVYGQVNINDLATLVQDIDSNTLVTNAGFSEALTQTLNLSAVAASGAFVLNYNGNATASINWNDSASTIQTKLRAVTGLSAATVTGSISSQSIVIALGSTTALGLIYATSNTLLTSGSASVAFSYNEGYTTTLQPSTKNYQLSVTAANIIIVPIVISATNTTVAPLGTSQLSAVGGYGAYTYSFQTNISGGSVNGSTGAYVAGSTAGTDVLKVTDVLNNTSTTVSIVVT